MTSDRAWLFTLVRAIPAAAVGLAITFSADHSARLGFIALSLLAASTGVVLLVGALLGAFARAPFAVQGVLLIVGGVLAQVFREADVATLLVLTSSLYGVTGMIELVSGLLARGRVAGARDWVFVGGLSALFAVAVLLVPVDLVDVISIPDAYVPPLTASIMIVGMLGAYAAIAAVYLVIAGLSLRPAAASTPATEG